MDSFVYGGCCRAQVMIPGCHFEANTPYTYQKWKFWWFCPEKWISGDHLTPNFIDRDWLRKFWVNLDYVLLVVREKRKMGTLQLFRRVRRFRIIFCHSSHLGMSMKANNAFKAKNGSVSWQKFAKSENDPFLFHLTPNFLDRDENGFLASSTPNPCANQCFY